MAVSTRIFIQIVLVDMSTLSRIALISLCILITYKSYRRDTNSRRDKNETKLKEIISKNTSEYFCLLKGFNSTCAKVQICLANTKGLFIFLSVLMQFLDIDDTKDAARADLPSFRAFSPDG
jgi:hypothetical protein